MVNDMNARRARFVKPSGSTYEVRPVMPKGKTGRYGKAPESIRLQAASSEDAIRRAVVSGFIPSNTVMQYYEAALI